MADTTTQCSRIKYQIRFHLQVIISFQISNGRLSLLCSQGQCREFFGSFELAFLLQVLSLILVQVSLTLHYMYARLWISPTCALELDK